MANNFSNTSWNNLDWIYHPAHRLKCYLPMGCQKSFIFDTHFWPLTFIIYFQVTSREVNRGESQLGQGRSWAQPDSDDDSSYWGKILHLNSLFQRDTLFYLEISEIVSERSVLCHQRVQYLVQSDSDDDSNWVTPP